AVKGLARLVLSGIRPAIDYRSLLAALSDAADKGDAECCWYLAYMYRDGVVLKPNAIKARIFMEQACKFKSEKAWTALRDPNLPQYSNPTMVVPGWATAYPVPEPAEKSLAADLKQPQNP